MPPPPSLRVGGQGRREPLPQGRCRQPRGPPDLTSPSRAFSGQAFLAADKHACLAHTVNQPFLRGGSPCLLSLLVTFVTKGVCSLFSQPLFLCPPQLGHFVFAFAEAATEFHSFSPRNKIGLGLRPAQL